MSSVTDVATPDGERAGWKTLLALCRVSNLPTVWMNVLTAVVLSGADVSPGVVVLLMASLSAFYCAGMSLNDVCDHAADAESQPFRPIPAGRISLTGARVVTGVLFVAGFGLLACAPERTAFGPAVVLLALIVGYDVLHKAHAATVVLMAATRLMVFVVAAWAVAGTASAVVIAAGVLQFGYTLLVTVVARYENTRGRRYPFPVIPRMIAAMALVDGGVLTLWVSPWWLVPGLGAALLTHIGQRYVRGD